MGVKMVVLDLDGTVLTSGNTLTERTLLAVKACIERGIIVTLATGRIFPSVLPFAQELGLKAPVITANGAEIRSPVDGKPLFTRPIPEDLAREIMTFFRKKGWYIQAYINDRLYVEQAEERAKDYGRLTFLEPVPLGEGLYTLKGDPVKLLSITPTTEEAVEVRKAVQDRFGNRLYAAVSNRLFVDMAHPEVSKAGGLRFLMDLEGIRRKETMVVGDSENDIPLFDLAGFSVAMGNARQDIKERAHFVTLSNDDDGVAFALERYVLEA
jgi:hypothetical protein